MLSLYHTLLTVLFILLGMAVITTSTMDDYEGSVLFTDEEYSTGLASWSSIIHHYNPSASANTTCNNDMRGQMPECHQFGKMWCWATGVAALTEYYNSSGLYQNCVGLECKIVGWCPTIKAGPAPAKCTDKKIQCCPWKSHLAECGNDYGRWNSIVEAAEHFTGRQHKLASGPLRQNILDATLQAGKPVLMGVTSGGKIGHVVQLRGW